MYPRGLLGAVLAASGAWEDEEIRKSIFASRGGEDDSTYYKYFEALARHLVALKEKRKGH